MYRHAAEDSATAEISRSQIWQWVRHGLRTEEGQQVCMCVCTFVVGVGLGCVYNPLCVQVTLELVYGLMQQTAAELWAEGRAAGLEEGALKVGRGQSSIEFSRWWIESVLSFYIRNFSSYPSHPHLFITLPPSTSQARILGAVQLYRNLVSAPSFPRFITTYLYEQALFQQLVRRALPVG